ncbi:MAG TPA: DNA primase [Salinisphaeraceae bacterium]|nr:DNA primase [Salinisphaeraceae bacterium]
MSRIPDDFIDSVLERTDIVPLIEARVPLKKTGREYQARCPFHDERTPSFTVSPQKQFYHCFGCGAHGTAISFLMEYDRMEFRDAIGLLAQQAGLEMPQGDQQRGQDGSRLAPLYEAMEQASRFYRQALRRAPQPIDYLKRRGITGATAKQFALGYAPDDWHSLQRLPDRSAAIRAGLLIEREDGRTWDRFRNRIMFPIRDTRGRIIAFGGRTLGEDRAKYLNSPETPLFHKSRHMYGLYEARQALRELPRLLVVEGYMDVIALAQHGFANTVATLGTATTAEQLNLLFRHTDEVMFCFDGDAAGERAAQKAMHESLPVMRGARRVRFLFLPAGEDPDSLVRGADGPARLQAAIEQAQPLSALLLQHVTGGAPELATPEQLAQVKERARPLFAAMPPGTFREEMGKELARLTRDEPEPLLVELTSRRDTAAQTADNARAIRVTAASTALQLLLHDPALAQQVDDTAALRASSVRGAELVADAVEFFRANPIISLARWLERYRDQPIFERLQLIAVTPPPGDDADQHRQAFMDSIRQILQSNRQEQLRERYNALLASQSTRRLDDDEAQELRAILAQLKPG